jgi:hypothetical protein
MSVGVLRVLIMAEKLRCERCGGESPTDARFCIDCGAPLAPVSTGATTRLPGMRCANCGTNNPEHARFCVVCGRGLGTDTAPAARPTNLPRPTVPPLRAPHSTRRQNYPRVAAPPAPITAAPRARPRPYHNNPAGALILLFGVLLLLGAHSLWPGILALIGISGLIRETNRGRPDRALTGMVWWCGLALLFATGTFWPGILALLFLSIALGGWGRGYGRWWW